MSKDNKLIYEQYLLTEDDGDFESSQEEGGADVKGMQRETKSMIKNMAEWSEHRGLEELATDDLKTVHTTISKLYTRYHMETGQVRGAEREFSPEELHDDSMRGFDAEREWGGPETH
tara:strand:+ start:261 stop:611 length:351 start_codon:yes stop_codon:yes gene_type:complete